jgi:hypothetical protein
VEYRTILNCYTNKRQSSDACRLLQKETTDKPRVFEKSVVLLCPMLGLQAL